MSTSKKRRKASRPSGRKPASAGIALAALDQVCWHLLCCDFLFDLIEADSTIAFHQLAADVEEARYQAERLLQHASRRKGWAANPEGSTAAVLLQRFEDQFEDDPPTLEDFTTGWPSCATTIDGQPCTGIALYLGKGDWSTACEEHATEGDLERLLEWRRGQHSAHRRAARRPDRRRQVGRALIDWWRGQSGAQAAFEAGMPGY